MDEAMDKHRKRRVVARAKRPDAVLEPFTGGVLAFHPRYIELCGEIIAEKKGLSYGWGILDALRETNAAGNYVCLNSRRLSERLEGRPMQNTVIRSVCTLRANISKVMRDRLGLQCNKDDVIATGRQGYHLSDRVVVEDEAMGIGR